MTNQTREVWIFLEFSSDCFADEPVKFDYLIETLFYDFLLSDHLITRILNVVSFCAWLLLLSLLLLVGCLYDATMYLLHMLQVIPRQLCDNAGFDATDVLNKLRQKHALPSG